MLLLTPGGKAQTTNISSVVVQSLNLAQSDRSNRLTIGLSHVYGPHR